MFEPMIRRLLSIALATLVTAGAVGGPVAHAAPARSAYAVVVDGILEDYYRRNPTQATDLGLHGYDGQLEDYSRAAVDDEVAAIVRQHRALAALDPATLDRDERLDREMLLGWLEGRRLYLTEVRSWARDPDTYSGGISNSAFSLIKRDYAPAEERMRRLIERERAMPAALAAARVNLSNPPKVYVEIAIEQIDGERELFRTAVVEAFAGVKDAKLQAELKKTNDAVIAALGEYKAWLEQLLPRADGQFAWGADLYGRMLRATEMVDTPLPRLLEVAEQDLKRNQAAFVETARQIDPSKTPMQVLADVQRDHPPADKLLSTTQDSLDALGRFMTERHIVTIPAGSPPAQVRETPPFMRATTTASMDTPGPFERTKMRGFYNMTPPDPQWSAAETEEFMTVWYYAAISNTSVHEVWPGHYLQFLFSPEYPTTARKVIYSNTNVEGWAHYCEQMVIDEGWHSDDPRYRLAQLQDALLRDARFVAGIRMHTQGMTIAEAEDFFEHEGYQPRPVAELETKRGTSDALYGYYTMGKLAILKLRDDYRRQQGAAYRLQDFHDRFNAVGPLPLPLVRELMLGERGSLF
ncbi:MAG: DUF885 domain-containing protein [Steroidobacteraceae bacterium]